MSDFFDELLGLWLATGEVDGVTCTRQVLAERALFQPFTQVTYFEEGSDTGSPRNAIELIGRVGDGYGLTRFGSTDARPRLIGRGERHSNEVAFDFDGGTVTYRRVPDGWDIEEVQRGKVTVQRLRQPRYRKVWAYVTEGPRLLVLRHIDQPLHLSGLQVVSGTLEDGEDPAVGVLREVTEETGRHDVEIVGSLGQDRQKWGYSDSDVFGFHLRFTEPTPERFLHGEFANQEHIRFGFFWMHVLDAEVLLSENQTCFLPELKRVLGIEVT